MGRAALSRRTTAAIAKLVVTACATALAACAEKGAIVEMELESIEARVTSTTSIDAFFTVQNTGTDPGTIEPIEILLYDASDGLLLSRYGTVSAALELDDGGIPAVFDGVAPPESMIRIRFLVRNAPALMSSPGLSLVASVGARVNGVARSYDSDGPIRVFFPAM